MTQAQAAPAPEASRCNGTRAPLAVLEAAVEQVATTHKAYTAALDHLRNLAGLTSPRADLLLALEKNEASKFWAREGIRQLEAMRGHKLMPEHV